MQAQAKQQDQPMDAQRREFDATKAELQACREQLESALAEVQEKAEHVDVMVSHFNDVVEAQLKPQLYEAETTATQLRGEVLWLHLSFHHVVEVRHHDVDVFRLLLDFGERAFELFTTCLELGLGGIELASLGIHRQVFLLELGLHGLSTRRQIWK
ncbi:unnamed protein product [Aphanomyces euteiches]